MKPAKKKARFSTEGGRLTLYWVAMLSFLATGGLLLAWDLIEHTYPPNTSEDFVHRMHIARGVSTGVLVSVGIGTLLLASRRRHDQKLTGLQRELIRKERLAAVGELAGGVAHEIRNPLTGIAGALTVLAREAPADDDTQEVMSEIQQQIQRMEHLVQELLAYAEPGVLHPEWIDLHSTLKQAIASVSQRRADPEVGLVLELDPTGPEVYADAQDLQNAFGNLVLNAFQAISKEGTIEVRTRYSGEDVLVSIHDDGSGIDAEVCDRIFDPFFTTKARGTGLGLPFVRRAVENYGGEIRVDSAPGEGTTFVFSIPTKAGSGARTPERAAVSG
jgi:signal transduction histidine kinase